MGQPTFADLEFHNKKRKARNHVNRRTVGQHLVNLRVPESLRMRPFVLVAPEEPAASPAPPRKVRRIQLDGIGLSRVRRPRLHSLIHSHAIEAVSPTWMQGFSGLNVCTLGPVDIWGVSGVDAGYQGLIAWATRGSAMPNTTETQRKRRMGQRTCGNCGQRADMMKPWGKQSIPICRLCNSALIMRVDCFAQYKDDIVEHAERTDLLRRSWQAGIDQAKHDHTHLLAARPRII